MMDLVESALEEAVQRSIDHKAASRWTSRRLVALVAHNEVKLVYSVADNLRFFRGCRLIGYYVARGLLLPLTAHSHALSRLCDVRIASNPSTAALVPPRPLT